MSAGESANEEALKAAQVFLGEIIFRADRLWLTLEDPDEVIDQPVPRDAEFERAVWKEIHTQVVDIQGLLKKPLVDRLDGVPLSGLAAILEELVHFPPPPSVGLDSSAYVDGAIDQITILLGSASEELEDYRDKLRQGAVKLTPDVFVPTPLQKNILKALRFRALKKLDLAAEVCGGAANGNILYRGDCMDELKDRGLVKNKRGVGYYRPDAPPDGAIIG